MLASLRRWGRGLFGSPPESTASDAAETERRLHLRHDFTGAEATLFVGLARYQIHLRDVSCSGASGLTDAPLKKGQFVGLGAGSRSISSAIVRWSRNAMVGVTFVRPLPFDLVHKLHERHSRRRAKALANRDADQGAEPAPSTRSNPPGKSAAS